MAAPTHFAFSSPFRSFLLLCFNDIQDSGFVSASTTICVRKTLDGSTRYVVVFLFRHSIAMRQRDARWRHPLTTPFPPPLRVLNRYVSTRYRMVALALFPFLLISGRKTQDGSTRYVVFLFRYSIAMRQKDTRWRKLLYYVSLSEDSRHRVEQGVESWLLKSFDVDLWRSWRTSLT